MSVGLNRRAETPLFPALSAGEWEKLQTFIELEAIKALAEYTGTVITENEDVQDDHQPSAASENSDVTKKGEQAAAAGCEVSIDSEGEGVQ